MAVVVVLVEIKTGRIIQVGDTLTNFRGEQGTVEAMWPHDGMNGKVKMREWMGAHYPSVWDTEYRVI